MRSQQTRCPNCGSSVVRTEEFKIDLKTGKVVKLGTGVKWLIGIGAFLLSWLILNLIWFFFLKSVIYSKRDYDTWIGVEEVIAVTISIITVVFFARRVSKRTTGTEGAATFECMACTYDWTWIEGLPLPVP